MVKNQKKALLEEIVKKIGKIPRPFWEEERENNFSYTSADNKSNRNYHRLKTKGDNFEIILEEETVFASGCICNPPSYNYKLIIKEGNAIIGEISGKEAERQYFTLVERRPGYKPPEEEQIESLRKVKNFLDKKQKV